MKKNNFQDLKNKPIAELRKELDEYRNKLTNLKFDLSMGKVKNIREIQFVKKSIARVLTILNDKVISK